MGDKRLLQPCVDESAIQFQSLRLEHITGLHSHVVALNNTHPLMDYPSFGKGEFSKELVLAQVQLRPIIVKAMNGKYVCAGNEHSFILAKAHLEPSDQVPVSLISNRNIKEITKLYNAEHLYLPILSGCGNDKYTFLISLWKSLSSSQIPWSTNPIPKIKTRSKFIKRLLHGK